MIWGRWPRSTLLPGLFCSVILVFVGVIADLDHFKRLNDEHGHPAADAALFID